MKAKGKVFPVKLRIIHQRKPKDFATIYSLSEEDYAKLKAPNVSLTLQQVREDLRKIQTQADEFIRKNHPFSFFEFIRDVIDDNLLFRRRKMEVPDGPEVVPSNFDFEPYFQKFPILLEDHSEVGTISGVFCTIIKQLITENRLGSAFKYRDSYRSLIKYAGNARFKDIDVAWLRRYEAHMLKEGKSKTTVGMVLRNLRTVFNEANHIGIINKQKCYPFGRRKYLIPTSRRTPKALGLEEIGMIYNYKTSCKSEEYAKSLWLFSYFGNGMNTKDLAHLKYKNIEGDFLTFDRAKTELTARGNHKSITVFLNEDMKAIIEKWGNKDRLPQNYIFPILKPDLGPLEMYKAVPIATRFINDWMMKIGKKLGFDLKLSTIVSRHSFSTRLKHAGVSTAFIQDSLGHMDIRTTENYLSAFDKESIKEHSGRLSDFKNR